MMSRILIIEDNAELRGNLLLVLEYNGFKVCGVGSAEEFYNIIKAEKFDIVIVDIGLPDKDDFELVEYLDRQTNCKIIILSARESVEDRVEDYEAGADIYFVKPVESAELIAAIKSIYGKIREAETENAVADKWVFEEDSWALTAPNNRRMILTSKEGAFVAAVMSKVGEIVPKESIMAQLGYDLSNAENNNSLDVLITRIRKKCREKCGRDLPVTTHRNRGYAFEEAFVRV